MRRLRFVFKGCLLDRGLRVHLAHIYTGSAHLYQFTWTFHVYFQFYARVHVVCVSSARFISFRSWFHGLRSLLSSARAHFTRSHLRLSWFSLHSLGLVAPPLVSHVRCAFLRFRLHWLPRFWLPSFTAYAPHFILHTRLNTCLRCFSSRSFLRTSRLRFHARLGPFGYWIVRCTLHTHAFTTFALRSLFFYGYALHTMWFTHAPFLTFTVRFTFVTRLHHRVAFTCVRSYTHTCIFSTFRFVCGSLVYVRLRVYTRFLERLPRFIHTHRFTRLRKFCTFTWFTCTRFSRRFGSFRIAFAGYHFVRVFVYARCSSFTFGSFTHARARSRTAHWFTLRWFFHLVVVPRIAYTPHH